MDLFCVAHHTRTCVTLHPQVDKGAGHHCSPLPFLQSGLLLQRPRYIQHLLLSSGAAEVCGLLVHQQQRASARGTHLCTCVLGALCLAGQTLRALGHTRAVRCEGRHDACHCTCHPVMHGITLVHLAMCHH